MFSRDFNDFPFGLIHCRSGSLVSGGGLQWNPPNNTSHQPPPRVNTTGLCVCERERGGGGAVGVNKLRDEGASVH